MSAFQKGQRGYIYLDFYAQVHDTSKMNLLRVQGTSSEFGSDSTPRRRERVYRPISHAAAPCIILRSPGEKVYTREFCQN